MFWNPDRTVYGPTGKTVNPSPSRFFYAQESVYAKNVGNRLNRGSTAQFWELWSNRFSRFPLNLNLKKKKKTQKNKRKRNTIAGSTSCLQKHCHYHLQRNKACLYVSSSSSSLFKEHHAAPSIQKLFSLAN